MMTLKKEKFQKLTIASVFDRHRVPIFHASCGGGRTSPLLKTLMSNKCINDCKFCPFRGERNVKRYCWGPKELAKIAIQLLKWRKIKGVFLSSSVENDPDTTFEKELEAVREMRKLGFNEYIHIKVMPGTSRDLIKEAVEIADRVGINVEFPGRDYYDEMKLFLDFSQDVLKRIKWLSKEVERAQKNGMCKAGMDSQIIVGAADDKDSEIIKISGYIYQKLKARRVYYSRFEPVKDTPLEKRRPENPLREYRLYQASFLLRDYGFYPKDFIFYDGMLNINEDPKLTIAKENEFLVDINTCKKEELIKIPGIGLKTAEKIIQQRPFKNIKDLKKTGIILKRAIPFIEISNLRQSTLNNWLN